MSIRCVNGVYMADTARVLGEVELGENVNVWYGAVIRGDVAPVRIGPGTNVQDTAVIHCDTDAPHTVGRDVTIGHGAIVHGTSVGDGTLIGMGARILGGARIGRDCLIAAGALVPPGLDVPDGKLVMGVPGRVIRDVSDEERRYLEWTGPHYVALAKLHAEQPDDPRVRPWDGSRHDATPTD